MEPICRIGVSSKWLVFMILMRPLLAGFERPLTATQAACSPRCRKSRDGWVPLRREDMAPLFGRSGNWNIIRQLLLDRCVLECDEAYVVGEKAKWYRVAPALRKCKAQFVTIGDNQLSARIRKIDSRLDEKPELLPPHIHIDQWLKKVRVDDAETQRWTCQWRSSFKHHLTALKIELLQSGQANVIVDAYGRIHSPVTNLRRVVRPALRIHGQELVEVDVSNAQPLILGFMASKLTVGDWSLEGVKRLGLAGPVCEAFTGLPMERWAGTIPGDLRDYLDICERGAFYQEVADIWELPCQSAKEKNLIKGLVYRLILFGRVRAGSRRWQAFRQRWPSVATMLEEMKQADYATSPRESADRE